MLDKLIDLLKTFGRFFQFWVVYDPWESGVILRLGEFQRMAKPGFNWIFPFMIEWGTSTNVMVHTLVIGPQSLMTKDGKQVVITTVITATIEDVKEFIFKINGGMSALDDAAPGVVSKLIMNKTLEELREMDIANELTKDIRRFAKPWGVGVTRVQLSDFTVMRSIRLLQSVAQTYPERKEF
jgi:regulator of protease activity HflC (stomatin/prohibitin superfamily)